MNLELSFRRALLLWICLTPACSAPDDTSLRPAPSSGGQAGMSANSGGATNASGGSSGEASPTGGAAGSAGSASAGATAGGSAGGPGEPSCEPGPIAYDLDCGAASIVLEAHGPPENRINYVIVGDGYTTEDLETTYPAHLDEMLHGHGTPGENDYRPGRFSPELEPYRRYRNFINICALKIASATSGVEQGIGMGWGQGCPGGASTAFDGCGDDNTRLGYISNDKVYAAVEDNLPATIEMDWVAVVFNNDRWWNSGGIPMVWSGGHADATLAAQHEGGHGFFILADEYGGNCGQLPQEQYMRINVTVDANATAGKWAHWLGTTQVFEDGITHDGLQGPGTGPQQDPPYEGGEYCNSGVYRPSDASVMNSLWANYYLNSISLENAVREIHEIIDPIDSHTPLDTTTPSVLEVKVIDPAVIKVEWSVDGSPVASSASCGQSLDVAALGLTSGSHVVTARAIDDTPWVPMDSPHGRDDLEQTVEWTIEVP